jgi:3-dehydroquinate synthase
MKGLSFSFSGRETRLRFDDRPELHPAAGRVLTVFDANTHRLFGSGIEEPLIVPAGEGAKSWPHVETLLEAALSRGLARDDTFLAVGGGVVCDLTAFAASLYMRGCGLTLIPTTLLAMVDASLGGKTGINFRGYKNMVGTFYPAGEIRICTAFLESLPLRELSAGLAEVIKTGMLGDPELLRLLEDRRAEVTGRAPEIYKEIVRRCLIVKGNIVAADPLEGGRRVFLNLGHTFAHALETLGGLKSWNHGEAVAWGLHQALGLGVELGVTRPEYARKITRLLRDYGFTDSGLPVLQGADAGDPASRLVETMRADKKRRGGSLRLVLQRDLGDTLIEEIKPEILTAYLQSK